MSSDSALLSSPRESIIVGFGGVCVDLLATVPSFPKPDTKNRTTHLKIQGGGNTGNAMTCAARLGLKPRIISKVANDAQGKALLEELQHDGVDTSFFVVSKEGTTSFSYIIVDSQTKTRTCIFTAGYPLMVPEDLPRESLLSALDGARVVYFDVRMPETALLIAQEAFHQNISILVDAERPREGLNELLEMADYVVCSEKFPQAKGSHLEEMDVDCALKSLTMKKDNSIAMPTCIASSVTKFRAEGIGTLCGRLYLGTAEKIPPSELIDTTGAGDAFVGAVLYAICANFSPEKMLPFASYVAATNCKALGARSGLPYRTDTLLSTALIQPSKSSA
ncbi:Ribokinase-like [Sesbania bispinosa]|nr:Ribokinase-like [Sesbania bispinosa]